MASLNSFARAATRPSVREIAASIFQPSYRCCARSRQAVSRTSSPRRAAFSSNRCPVARKFSSTTYRSQAAKANPPISTDRGPTSSETTQTDFNQLDVLGNTPIPSTNIDACLWDGFHLNNGVKITEGAGVLLVAGEAFSWRPWETDILGSKRLLNDKGQWEVGDDAWGVLGMVWPKPGMHALCVVVECLTNTRFQIFLFWDWVLQWHL